MDHAAASRSGPHAVARSSAVSGLDSRVNRLERTTDRAGAAKHHAPNHLSRVANVAWRDNLSLPVSLERLRAQRGGALRKSGLSDHVCARGSMHQRDPCQLADARQRCACSFVLRDTDDRTAQKLEEKDWNSHSLDEQLPRVALVGKLRPNHGAAGQGPCCQESSPHFLLGNLGMQVETCLDQLHQYKTCACRATDQNPPKRSHSP